MYRCRRRLRVRFRADGAHILICLLDARAGRPAYGHEWKYPRPDRPRMLQRGAEGERGPAGFPYLILSCWLCFRAFIFASPANMPTFFFPLTVFLFPWGTTGPVAPWSGSGPTFFGMIIWPGRSGLVRTRSPLPVPARETCRNGDLGDLSRSLYRTSDGPSPRPRAWDPVVSPASTSC